MIKKIMNVLLITAMLAVLAVPVFSRPVKLEYKYRTGQSNKYKVVVKTEQSAFGGTGLTSTPPTKDTVNIVMVQKVTKVNKHGSAAVDLIIKGAGTDIKRIPQVNRKVLISKTGEYLGVKGSVPGSSEGNAIVLPKKRVSVGDTWSTVVALPGSTGTLKAIATYKGLVSNGGRRVHKILQTYSGVVDMSKMMADGKTPPIGSSVKATIVGSGTYLLDRKDCRLVSVTGRIITTTRIVTPRTKSIPARTTQVKSQMDTTVARM